MGTHRMAALLLVASLGGTAYGHEGGTHARGTVKEVSADRLVLAPLKGAPVAFTLRAETRIRRGTAPAGVETIRVGERAVVHARPGPKGPEATDVILGEASK